jgi:hypothetical protein
MSASPQIQSPTVRDDIRAIHDPYGGVSSSQSHPVFGHAGGASLHPHLSSGQHGYGDTGPSHAHQSLDHGQGGHGHGLGPGWGPEDWAQAGGFEHILGGHLGELAHGGPVVVVPIDHLVINNNTLIQNDVTQVTNLLLDTGPGGSIDIGGNVDAISHQTTAIFSDQSHGFGNGTTTDFGLGQALFGDGTGEHGLTGVGLGGSGGLDAVFFGHLPTADGSPSPLVIIPIENLEINNNTVLQNTATEVTNLALNAGAGGAIHIGGNVDAVSDQQTLIAAQDHGAGLLQHA